MESDAQSVGALLLEALSMLLSEFVDVSPA